MGGGDTVDTTPRAFSFDVLGDAPYRWPHVAQFRRVIRQMNDTDLSLVIDIGEILWYPCSEAFFQNRLAMLQSVRHPLVYTPGDNECTDGHEALPGSYEPLDRLEVLRSILFADPTRSLGENSIPLTVQAADSAWLEFVENARWVISGIVFATIHLVGSRNVLDDFVGRTERHDWEVAYEPPPPPHGSKSTFAVADSTDVW